MVPWGEQKDPAAGSVLKMEATGSVEIVMWDMRESNGSCHFPGRGGAGVGMAGAGVSSCTDIRVDML